ncbi:MAG: YggS family pyridoxal phosphate-dependent enzyme [Williamsia sp.]|nr:YggS family pyridoxal phosphate-dependent enzyme [Williamsia sp.]
MPVNTEKWKQITEELGSRVTLVAVSKTKPVEDIQDLYNLGQRDFGENYVQELVGKQALLPHDIRWHFIGHLQSNKVKDIVSFVHLIQGVDSIKLLKEVQKQAAKAGKVVSVLLQVHIAQEETKFGLDNEELAEMSQRYSEFPAVRFKGLMGMASNTPDSQKVEQEFSRLKSLFDLYASSAKDNWQITHLSMGMSGDYQTAIKQGSNMVRIGSLLFGERNYLK